MLHRMVGPVEMAQWVVEKAVRPVELARWVWTRVRARSAMRERMESAREGYAQAVVNRTEAQGLFSVVTGPGCRVIGAVSSQQSWYREKTPVPSSILVFTCLLHQTINSALYFRYPFICIFRRESEGGESSTATMTRPATPSKLARF